MYQYSLTAAETLNQSRLLNYFWRNLAHLFYDKMRYYVVI